jgi:hypothetical protein
MNTDKEALNKLAEEYKGKIKKLFPCAEFLEPHQDYDEDDNPIGNTEPPTIRFTYGDTISIQEITKLSQVLGTDRINFQTGSKWDDPSFTGDDTHGYVEVLLTLTEPKKEYGPCKNGECGHTLEEHGYGHSSCVAGGCQCEGYEWM